MALASYFAKDLLALNQLLSADSSVFEKKLESTLIQISFEKNAESTPEGRTSLELLVRLLARLYPRLSFYSSHLDLTKEMTRLAKKVNSSITIKEADVTPTLIVEVGEVSSKRSAEDIPILYVGANNWVALFSSENPQKFGNSENPIGASMAACIAASNIFRFIFSEELGEFGALDATVALSGYSLNHSSQENPLLKKIELKDVILCGVGAIGNGAVWTLGRIPKISGNLTLVDHEKIELSNLQRYILTDESHWKNKSKKVVLGKAYMRKYAINLKCNDFFGTWEEYVSQRIDKAEAVLVAIDKASGRINIQSSLPKIIFNAFTESEVIGLSRHLKFGNESCLACGHLPDVNHQKLHYHEEIAANFQIDNYSDLIKAYLNTKTPVGDILPPYSVNNHPPILLDLIKRQHNIGDKELEPFRNKLADELYSELICGGLMLEMTNLEKKLSQIDAPVAFQSAMAGVLLAAELIKYCSGDLPRTQRTDFYPLASIQQNNPFNRSLTKRTDGRCICEDDDFLETYNDYWI